MERLTYRDKELKILRRRANRGKNGCKKEIIDGF